MRSSLAFAVLTLVACRYEGPQPIQDNSMVDGSLAYEASSLAGKPLIRGRLNIDILPDSSIVGTWTADWAPGADRTVEVGDQIGRGTLRGRQTAEGGYIVLNPGYADNNVILLPTATDRGFTGTWYWSTNAGPRTQGRFTALRN
jgi:hypothetical protein